MATKTLTIDGITFPDFIIDKSKNKNDNSKKNFRLNFIIAYKNSEGKTETVVIPKPEKGHWQWRNDDKDFFLPSTPSGGNSVDLNTDALRLASNGFNGSDFMIAEIDGDISIISVQFIDVHDNSPLDVVVGTIIPALTNELKKSNIDLLDFVPIPGGSVIKGLIKQNINVDELSTKVLNSLSKGSKDKTLNQIIKKYNGENPFVIKQENVVWDKNKNKSGTYAVTIGFE